MSDRLPNPNLSSPELAPNMPELKVSFYLGAHGTAEDFEGISDQMKDAHIYFYENSYPAMTQLLQEIADLSLDVPSDVLESVDAIIDVLHMDGRISKGTPTETIIRNIYGTGIVIGEMDVSLQDWHIRDALREEFSKPSPVENTFTETLDRLEHDYVSIVELQTAREQIMLDRFSEQIAAMVTKHPQLQGISQLNVAVTLGAYHTGVYHGLARTPGIEVAREFSSKPFHFSFPNEVMRSIAFGIPPSQKLLAQAYLSNIMSNAIAIVQLDDRPVDWNMHTQYLSNVIPSFSLEEIESIYEKDRDGSLRLPDIETLLVERGLGYIPTTEAQFLAHAEASGAKKLPSKKVLGSLGAKALPRPTL